jgi:hypothetical protein
MIENLYVVLGWFLGILTVFLIYVLKSVFEDWIEEKIAKEMGGKDEN